MLSKNRSLHKQFIKQFGRQQTNQIIALENELGENDIFIAESLENSLENLLLVKKSYISTAIVFLHSLSKTSKFAACFFIEKIPALLHFNLLEKFIYLIEKNKDYGARNIAYLLGSNKLRNDDLEDVLSTVDTKFYNTLLDLILKKEDELNILSAPILRYANKIYLSINDKQLQQFIDDCIYLNSNYGHETVIKMLENIDEITKVIKISDIRRVLIKFNDISIVYAEFFYKFPKVGKITKSKKFLNSERKKIMLEILSKNRFELINTYPILLEDRYFSAIVLNWSRYDTLQKENIIFQLKKLSYLNFINKNKNTLPDIKKINLNTQKKWFSCWMYINRTVDNAFIYGEIKKTMHPNCNYKFSEKNIYQEKKNLFQKIKDNYNSDPLITLIKYLESIATNEKTKITLSILKNTLKKEYKDFISTYSSNDLLIKTWDRDPWVDYARSDEIYSCTSIGRSADIYAPIYLADLNINNLDIINNNIRIGRMHLILVKDNNNKISLLVDSIEGSDRLMRNTKRLEILYNALLSYAKSLGIKSVFFNSDLAFNNTPKLFIEFLENKIKNKETYYVKRFISKASNRNLIPHDYISFLESLKMKEAGLITGFSVKSL